MLLTLFIVAIVTLSYYYQSILQYVHNVVYIQDKGSVGDNELDKWLYNIRKIKLYNASLMDKLYDRVERLLDIHIQCDKICIYNDIYSLISEIRFYVPDDDSILNIYDYNTVRILRKCKYYVLKH